MLKKTDDLVRGGVPNLIYRFMMHLNIRAWCTSGEDAAYGRRFPGVTNIWIVVTGNKRMDGKLNSTTLDQNWWYTDNT